mmetsp:Transcript_15842/g.32465  ORF Transcript_15842/g.32465 Transcript_15842/m.32465 type:complete len:210 (-) Transcript_15842:1376-2005(-)
MKNSILARRLTLVSTNFRRTSTTTRTQPSKHTILVAHVLYGNDRCGLPVHTTATTTNTVAVVVIVIFVGNYGLSYRRDFHLSGCRKNLSVDFSWLAIRGVFRRFLLVVLLHSCGTLGNTGSCNIHDHQNAMVDGRFGSSSTGSGRIAVKARNELVCGLGSRFDSYRARHRNRRRPEDVFHDAFRELFSAPIARAFPAGLLRGERRHPRP